MSMTRPLKVLHSHPCWLPRTQTWMYHLIRSTNQEVESGVSCYFRRFRDEFPLENMHCLKEDQPFRFQWNRLAHKLRLPIKFNRLEPHLKLFNPDIVHSHFGNVGALDQACVENSSAKHLVTFYGYDVSKAPRRNPWLYDAYKKMFRTVDMVLCEGSSMAAKVNKLGCPKHLIKVQHLGVDLGRQFLFRPRKWKSQEKLRILIACSFREKKGVPYAIEAIGRLARDIDLEVTIVGDASEEPSSIEEKNKIVGAINEWNLKDKVSLLGFQPHKEMIRQAYEHHLFVSTSVTAVDGDCEGGAPVSLTEMAATGMPIVSSVHCDIPEVIIDGETGWLAVERNVDSIEEKLRDCLSNHNQWPEILASGREHVEKEYNLSIQGQRLAELYRSVVSRGPQ